MFVKSVVIVGLCVFAFVKCQPSINADTFKGKNFQAEILDGRRFRVERAAQQLPSDPLQMAGQMAGKFTPPNVGMGDLSNMAQSAMGAGAQSAGEAMKNIPGLS